MSVSTSEPSNRSDSYDEVPYPSGPFWRSHPSHLAVIGRLFGLNTPDVATARVLELGCASGGNCIPIAVTYPSATVVGVDLSLKQIEAGQAVVRDLQLTNIQLRHLSITEIDETLGTFDYILCHGVYSWVPPVVQAKILDLGRTHLSPQGVLYVSYNTYPGWHMRALVRDMLLYHTARFEKPQTRIDQSRGLLDFLIRGASSRTDTFHHALRDEAQILQSTNDAYLFHEHLESHNEPLYFHQFAERAAAAGLQYLGEADFDMMLAQNFDPATEEVLKGASLLRQEQYMDFLRNRMFRSTLLCHAECSLDRHVKLERLEDFEFSFPAALAWIDPTSATAQRPQDSTLALAQLFPGDLNDRETIWRTQGRQITTRAAITAAAFLELDRQWPQRLPFQQLFAAAFQQLTAYPQSSLSLDSLRQRLLDDLLQLLATGLIRATYQGPPMALQPGEKPRATALARHQAAQPSSVTTQWHTSASLDPLARFLLTQLDGTCDRTELARRLKAEIAAGRLTVRLDDRPLTQIDAQTLTTLIEHGLKTLTSQSLLIPAHSADNA